MIPLEKQTHFTDGASHRTTLAAQLRGSYMNLWQNHCADSVRKIPRKNLLGKGPAELRNVLVFPRQILQIKEKVQLSDIGTSFSDC